MKKMSTYPIAIALLLLGSQASAHNVLTWNGQWRTTIFNVMSVCGTTSGFDIEAGPIWSNVDAQTKCPLAVAKYVQEHKSGEIRQQKKKAKSGTTAGNAN